MHFFGLLPFAAFVQQAANTYVSVLPGWALHPDYQCFYGDIYKKAACCHDGDCKVVKPPGNHYDHLGGPGLCFNEEYRSDNCCFPMPVGNPDCWLGHVTWNRCCGYHLYPSITNNTHASAAAGHQAFLRTKWLDREERNRRKYLLYMHHHYKDQYQHSSGCKIDFSQCVPMSHTKEDLKLITSLFFETKAQVYVEIGTGCSANYFPFLAERTIAVESNPEYCQMTLNSPLPKCLHSKNKFEMLCIPNTTSTWVDEYVTAIDQAHIPDRKIDIALVDGLHRIANALYLLNYNVTYLLIHDWPGGVPLKKIMDKMTWKDRHDFRIVLVFYDIVFEPEYGSSLAVFQRRADTTDEDARTAWKHEAVAFQDDWNFQHYQI